MIDAEYCQTMAAYNGWMNRTVYAAAARLPDEVRKAVETAQQPSSGFDTHPPDASRIECARRENAEAVFRLEGQAVGLFAA